MKNILIVKFGALGDVVRTSYILPGLHKKYKNCRIFWLTSSLSFDLLRFNPHIFKIVTPEFRFKEILSIQFDLVISLDDEREVLDLLNNIQFTSLTGAYLKDSTTFYSDNSSIWFDMGIISRFGLKKADKLKKSNQLSHNLLLEQILEIKINKPEFYNSPVIQNKKKNLIDKDYFNIGLNSGSGSRWPAKSLILTEAIKLIKKLINTKSSKRPIRILLLGGPDEKERNLKIQDTISINSVVDTGSENSLLEFAAIIANLDYLISSDSLALHLGIAQQIPTLSFFAPTSAAEIGTFGTGIKIKSTADDYCNYKPDCDNSSITCERLYDAFLKHVEQIDIVGP